MYMLLAWKTCVDSSAEGWKYMEEETKPAKVFQYVKPSTVNSVLVHLKNINQFSRAKYYMSYITT